jgi:hypothetical protein
MWLNVALGRFQFSNVNPQPNPNADYNLIMFFYFRLNNFGNLVGKTRQVSTFPLPLILSPVATLCAAQPVFAHTQQTQPTLSAHTVAWQGD